MEIMNFNHPKWDNFIIALSYAIEECDHSHSYTKRTLRYFGQIDIEKSIEFLKSKGGYCDCEVMFNVEQYKQ